jgi:hypothetical protein
MVYAKENHISTHPISTKRPIISIPQEYSQPVVPNQYRNPEKWSFGTLTGGIDVCGGGDMTRYVQQEGVEDCEECE